MSTDRSSLIRKAIEEAQPAEDFIAEQTHEIDDKDFYQAHLDALTNEYNALQTEEYLNEIEALSVQALAAYAAHNHNMKEPTVCAIVEAYFHVDDIRKLYRHDYEAVIRYLVDFNPVKLIN